MDVLVNAVNRINKDIICLFGITPTFAPPAANRAKGASATGQKTALWACF